MQCKTLKKDYHIQHSKMFLFHVLEISALEKHMYMNIFSLFFWFYMVVALQHT
jgi:hypothetical protein